MFRKSTDRNFKTGTTFDCPFGVPWGAVVTPKPPPTPEEMAAGKRKLADAWVMQGPAMWAELHTKRGADQKYLDEFAGRIPCGECLMHWLEMLKRTPPVFGEGWFEWSWARHEEVNARLGKPSMTLEAARARWLEPAQGESQWSKWAS